MSKIQVQRKTENIWKCEKKESNCVCGWGKMVVGKEGGRGGER